MFVLMTLTKSCAHKIQLSTHHYGLPPLIIKGESQKLSEEASKNKAAHATRSAFDSLLIVAHKG